MGSLRRGLIVSSAAVVALLAGAAQATAGAPSFGGGLRQAQTDSPAAAAFAPGQVIVQFRAGVSAVARREAFGARGAEVVRTFGEPGLALVRLRSGTSVPRAVAAFERDSNVAFAEPNYVYRVAQVFPNDPQFSELWGLHASDDRDIDAPEAWQTQTGSAGVVVAVIDSGVAYGHPDLSANIWANDDPPGGGDNDGNGLVDDTNGWDFVQEDNTPVDYFGHGTHVAGTIGAKGDNATGITGVSWQVQIMPVRAGNAVGTLRSSNVLAGIEYACTEGADIVNGSFGGSGKSLAIGNAIKGCSGTLFVFSAGNDRKNLNGNTKATNAYPCELHRPAPHGVGARNLVCVAATNRSDDLAGFSNRGSSAVHLGAPGVSVLSTQPEWSSVAFADGFESDFADWTQAGGTGAWQRTMERAQSGSWSMTDSPGGRYPNNATITIRNLPAADLTGRVGCRVGFGLAIEILDFSGNRLFDWFDVVGSESPTGPWQDDGLAYFGDTNGEFEAVHDTLSFLDGSATAYVRFLVRSDASLRFDGAHVDDVSIECLTAAGEEYERFGGTSMASPHVAGVAALLLAEEPTLTARQLKSALLRGVDRRAGLRDRVSTGGRLNADKSLAIVEGPA